MSKVPWAFAAAFVVAALVAVGANAVEECFASAGDSCHSASGSSSDASAMLQTGKVEAPAPGPRRDEEVQQDAQVADPRELFEQSQDIDELTARFHDFIEKYGRRYTDEAEYDKRFEIFVRNVRLIEAEGKRNHTHSLGINNVTDMSPLEFKATYFGLHITQNRFKAKPLGVFEAPVDANLPDEWDWRDHGAVTPVKDQGSCGSCWTFASAGALEGAWAIKSGTLVSLSQQQFMDCASARKYYVYGCNGGDLDGAFRYAMATGLYTAASYPYHGAKGECSLKGKDLAVPHGAVAGYMDVPPTQHALLAAVYQQPVAVGIQAYQNVFQFYSGGVVEHGCGTNLDHAVLVVGYGSESADLPYWIVKNSWGSWWGEQGYVRIKRGVNSMGECGILMMPSFPVMA